jgi:hypothetical protein
VSRLQNRSGCPHHSLGLSCVGIRLLLPKMGHGSARPATEAPGPPAVDASGAAAVDVSGLSSAKVTSLRSPTSATTVIPSSWSKMGRSGMTEGRGTSAISISAVAGGSADESAAAPAGIDVGAGNNTGRLGAAAASTTSPGMMAAPTGGSTWEACPMTARAAWAPHRRAPCAEANQPAWRAATPAAEADPVLSAFAGASPAEPCLRLLKGRRGKFKTHSEITETEVPSDTHPLRGKANRACGDTPRAPVSAGTAEGCLAACFDAASTSDALGAEGAAYPGNVTIVKGPISRTAGMSTCSWGACGSACPPESPQLSRPRGQVPHRPASAPPTGTPASRPQTLVTPAPWKLA